MRQLLFLFKSVKETRQGTFETDVGGPEKQLELNYINIRRYIPWMQPHTQPPRPPSETNKQTNSLAYESQQLIIVEPDQLYMPV